MKRKFTKNALLAAAILLCSNGTLPAQEPQLHIYRMGVAEEEASIAKSGFDSVKVENSATLKIYKVDAEIYSSAVSTIDSIKFVGNEETTAPVNITVENPSFEPASGITGDQIFDFNNIPGWKWGEPKYYSNVAEWGNNDVKKYGSYLNNKLQQSSWSHFTDTSIDGDYVMCVSHYSRQVWQQLQEKVHNNVRYTVTVNAGMNQWANPAPNGANHYVRIQLAIFNDAVGDLNNITVLKEECIPLTAEDKGVFNQKQLIYDAPALSPHFGKQMIITLSGYQESDPLPGNAIIKWTDQNYFFDMLQITRQKISQ